MYDLYDRKNLEDEENFTKLELKEAMDEPIQLHYATHIKPWNNLSCTKSEILLEYLLKTNFVRKYLEEFHRPKKITEKIKNIFSISFKYGKNRRFRFSLEKIRSLQ
jgi:lipopolysaccharide biosynthesis glycosyltransferase